MIVNGSDAFVFIYIPCSVTVRLRVEGGDFLKFIYKVDLQRIAFHISKFKWVENDLGISCFHILFDS